MTQALDHVDRRLALAAGAAGLVGGLVACGRSGGPKPGQTRLRVGVFKGGVETFMAAAGQAAPTPYSVTTGEFAAGNLITEAIIADALDLGSMSEIPPIFVAAARTPLRLITVLKGDVNSQLVLVPAKSPITTPAELKGRHVGYVRATTSHFLLLKLLEEHRLSFKDIHPVALSPQDGRTAFEHGSLDAWVAYGVQAEAARVTMGARVLTTGLGRLSGNYLYAASEAALKDPPRRAAIIDYLGRVQRAYRWAEANPGPWASLVAAATGVPASLYERQRRERSAPTSLTPVDAAAVASQQAVADGFAKAGVIPARVDVTPLWETSLNTELAGLWR
jgi:sulfonate transport system substrate-binding protein